MARRHLVAVLCLAASSAVGQVPDTFTNLQVLPKDIKKQALLDEMRRWAGATGLHCEGCHTGKTGSEEMDWASDDKETKKTARVMFRMTRAINGDHLSKIGLAKPLEVTCNTCHRGISRPVPLEDLVLTAVRQKGLDAGVATYKELRAANYGRASYDFGERTLNRAAQTLVAEGKAKEAVGLVELNLSFGAKDAFTQVALSDAKLAAGDRPGAIAALKKAAEIEPKSEQIRRRLERLEKPEAPKGEAPKTEAPKTEAPKTEAPKTEAPKQ